MKIGHGTVAIVTGGSRGIGKACTEAFLAKGAKVCFIGIKEELGKQLESQLKIKYGAESVIFIQCDVVDAAKLENVFSVTKDTFGKIDILVNNAGIVDEQNWERCLQVNTIGAFSATVLALKHMGRNHGNGGGVIINMASNLGLEPFCAEPAYATSKYAIVGMTRSFGTPEHLEEKGVRVNCVCPVWVETDMVDDELRDSLYPALVQAIYDSVKHALIAPATVADATIQLIEDESKNGEALLIQQDSSFEYMVFQQVPTRMPPK